MLVSLEEELVDCRANNQVYIFSRMPVYATCYIMTTTCTLSPHRARKANLHPVYIITVPFRYAIERRTVKCRCHYALSSVTEAVGPWARIIIPSPRLASPDPGEVKPRSHSRGKYDLTWRFRSRSLQMADALVLQIGTNERKGDAARQRGSGVWHDASPLREGRRRHDYWLTGADVASS